MEYEDCESTTGSGLFVLFDFGEAVVVFRCFKDRQPCHRPIEDVRDFTSRTNAFWTRHAGSITDSLPPEKSPDPLLPLHSSLAPPFYQNALDRLTVGLRVNVTGREEPTRIAQFIRWCNRSFLILTASRLRWR